MYNEKIIANGKSAAFNYKKTRLFKRVDCHFSLINDASSNKYMPTLMKKVYLILFTALLTLSSLSVYAVTFVHPGGLHTIADLERMKEKVSTKQHPWIDGWDLLTKDPLAQNTYAAHPYTNIGGSGNRQQASKDAHAVYYNTIRWYVTGDTTFAECAVRICNAWSTKVNEVASGELFQLPINNFMQAAELLRIYPGWNAVDFARFKDMAINYFYPACHNFVGNCRYPSSWDGSALASIMGIGLLCDDTLIFNEAVSYFKNGSGSGCITNAICQPSGQIAEMGRDQPHASIGPAMLAEMCQTAWNQGFDLYSYSDNLIMKGFEYYCKFNLNHPVIWIPYNNCSNDNWYYVAMNSPYRIRSSPVYEMLYNHFAVRKGLKTPYTEAMANLARPEQGDADLFGYGTLTYTLDAKASPYPAYPTPSSPTELVAVPGVSRVYLKWAAPSGDVTQGYKVLRSTTSDGPFETIASWKNNTMTDYTDKSVSNGTTYYYVVSASNQSGASAASVQTRVTPVEATAKLPVGWQWKDVGNVTEMGSAVYANVGNNTFQLSGSGAVMGDTADSHSYIYKNIKGNCTITVRLADVVWSNKGADKVGVVMRESLDANSKRLTLQLGEIGYRLVKFGIRAQTAATTSWQDGNKFTWIPVWFRLQRVGDTFTASQSSDGIKWFVVGKSKFKMNNCYTVGLSVCAGNANGIKNTTTFDHVKTTQD